MERATLPALAALVLATAAPASDAPRLVLPLDCTLGTTCFIQNYVDALPGPDAQDFTCGTLTYDGHKGTDFALTSFSAMEAGVAVRAAAAGVVRATRDGMPDTGRAGTPADMLAGKDCGNGVVIDHGGGWETQYCHMKQGSISVRRGARVEAGSELGLVGFSGRTDTPHVHLSVRKDGKVVDPFDLDGTRRCGFDDGPDDDLWTVPIGYAPAGLIAVGVAPEVPSYASVKQGEAAAATLPATSPALVGWAYLFGAQAGDTVEIAIERPDGRRILLHRVTIDKPLAQAYRAAGKRRPPGGWLPGEWRVSVRLIRDGTPIDSRAMSAQVTP